MKLHYYPDTDSLYVELKAGPGTETREVSDGLNVDLDAAGSVLGFDIDHASKRLRPVPARDRGAARALCQGRLRGDLVMNRAAVAWPLETAYTGMHHFT